MSVMSQLARSAIAQVPAQDVTAALDLLRPGAHDLDALLEAVSDAHGQVLADAAAIMGRLRVRSSTSTLSDIPTIERLLVLGHACRSAQGLATIGKTWSRAAADATLRLVEERRFLEPGLLKQLADAPMMCAILADASKTASVAYLRLMQRSLCIVRCFKGSEDLVSTLVTRALPRSLTADDWSLRLGEETVRLDALEALIDSGEALPDAQRLALCKTLAAGLVSDGEAGRVRRLAAAPVRRATALDKQVRAAVIAACDPSSSRPAKRLYSRPRA
jgi:hypothetical protein